MPKLDSVRITRQQLYELVWSTPLSQLASRYGISDRGLAKICARLNIPVPGRGFWARKSAGKHVIQYNLPPPDSDTPHDVLISPTEAKKLIPPVVKKKLESPAVSTGEITVPERLKSPHPVIKSWIEDNKEKRRRDKEEIKYSPLDRDFLRRMATKPFTQIERRQHRILDTLFKELEKHGFKIQPEPYNRVHLEYEDIKIEFGIREKNKQIRRPPNDKEKRWTSRTVIQEMQPAGMLVFSIKTWLERGLKSEWLETKNKPLEEQLPDILNALIIAVPLLVENKRKREEEDRRRREEEYRRYLIEEERKQDCNRWQRFLEFTDQWRQAEQARKFLALIEEKGEDLETTIDKKTLNQWLDWARAWVEHYDPLNESIEAIFKSISKVESWSYK